jgi:uncharacterized membrane protein (UPF0127 family)
MAWRKKMILFFVGIALVAMALGASAWFFLKLPPGGCNPPLPRKTIVIGSVSFDSEIASTITEQACGLSGRAILGEREGMFFAFDSGGTQNFWMKDMKFPIDMIWISGNKVAGFAENALPPNAGDHLWNLKIYTSPSNVDKVLEVPAGTVAKNNIKVGDAVSGF